MKKSPITRSTIGASARIRNRKSCKISTRTPSGVSENTHHPSCPSFKMIKINFGLTAIYDLLRVPRDWNPGTPGCHHHDVAIRSALEKPDVTVMGENFRPQLQVCCCFKDHHLRRLHDNRVDSVHGNDDRRQMETRLDSDVAQLSQN